MTIHVRAAIGESSTEIAAFDDALLQVGAGNYNVVQLSSVIPPRSHIRVGEPPDLGGDSHWGDRDSQWGDRLYAVYAVRTSLQPHDHVWAGLGWVQESDGEKRGLFVEHHGHSQDEVEELLRSSLADMCAARRVDFGEVATCVTGTKCPDGRAVCALVLAAYETGAWAAANASRYTT